jgi:predicted amidophosphoribosyltransferase
MVAFMSATNILLGLLIMLFTILLLRWVRRLKPQLAGFQSQRMCPSCGLITSRLKARCLECGKPFAAVVYSTSKK